MRWILPQIPVAGIALPIILLFVFALPTLAQSTASIDGQVIDQHGAVLPGVKITVKCPEIGIDRAATSDPDGRYQFAALPVGDYSIGASADGFKTQVLEGLRIEVGRRITQDLQLEVGDVSEQVIVTSTNDAIERSTTSVGHVVDQRMVQELPLNGRYFLDLGLLVPGSVTSPQGAFSSAPIRGLGSFSITTAGNREETVNYVINGITLNNLTNSSITFQPSIGAVQEFKVDNSTFSAEHGQSSGAIVNIATRSGSNEFHGEIFEFFRNDVLDARNFFTFTSAEPPPFKRNQFGGQLGGPIVKEKLFFFFSYEGLRQRQRVDLNSLVLSDSQRASASDPVTVKLLPLIPRANFVDSSGTSRFVGSANASVNNDQWGVDISYNLGKDDRLHAFYSAYRTELVEPNRNGNTIPGFGNTTLQLRQVFTLNETHIFSPMLVNELRFGFNRFSSATTPNAQLNPTDFGINHGVTDPIGLPQITVAGGLNFGGPSINPSGRADTTYIVADSFSYLRGKHSLKGGGEYRQFLNNNFRQGTGSFNFPTVAAFLAGTANSFSVTLGSQSSSIAEGALGFFVQDNYRLRSNLMLELGLRYEWNMTPSERYDRFIVFDPATASLIRVGNQIDKVYQQNNKNVQPRVGFAWDPFGDGKTSVRAAYALQTDQPMTSIVIGTTTNPPLGIPLTFSGTIRLDNAINLARPAGLAPQSITGDFSNAYLQSWNFNVQRELLRKFILSVGYIGSKGTNLILRRNLNQPINGVRPFPTLSQSSPILPGTNLGNITQVESGGNSSYNALWIKGQQRLARGLQFQAFYTWSKSLDYNSFSTGGVVGQDSYNLDGDRGLSDFDARHRFVFNGIYDLPFRGNLLLDGWQLATIVQLQTGSPINIVTNNTTVNGIGNTLRPDVTGPIARIGRVERWFDTSVFTAVPRFGNLGRNVVIGPGFSNTDFAIIKNTKVGETLRVQFRAEFFDLFNHANFGAPGAVVGTPAFGQITSTRFPTGESGSSRQIQFAVKVSL
ncbi:MAG TPA: carboxypeptidase regulatory-like domain-containing protein [Pyrinomonadaceae bacterium]|nr:carboxypeptidase regulatory-like domain-containing protein [Pyrinomonadaceae bacterium]